MIKQAKRSMSKKTRQVIQIAGLLVTLLAISVGLLISSTAQAAQTHFEGQWNPAPITNNHWIYLAPNIKVVVDYEPGEQYMHVTCSRVSCDHSGDSNDGDGFWDGFVITTPPYPNDIGPYVFNDGQDTSSNARSELTTWATQGGRPCIWAAAQSNYHSQYGENNIEFGEIISNASYSFNIDVSGLAPGSSPTLLVLGDRYRLGYSEYYGVTGTPYSVSFVHKVEELTADDLGITIKMPPKITSSADTGGSISPNGVTYVEYEGDQGYSITPSTYWKIKDVKVDGTSVGAVSSYTFTNVTYDRTIHAEFEPITGSVKIQKQDQDLSTNQGQGNASLNATEFKVYCVSSPHYATGALVATATTNANGYLEVTNIKGGQFKIKETTASGTYDLTDTTEKTFEIQSDGQVCDLTGNPFKNQVKRGGVLVKKVDANDGSKTPQGDAGNGSPNSFSGTTYYIYNRSTNPVYIANSTYRYSSGQTTYAKDALCAKIVSDADGVAQCPGNVLPIGTYEIYEATPPTGYLNSGFRATFAITSAGQVVKYETSSNWNRQPVMRGDLKIQKADTDWQGDSSRYNQTQGDANETFQGTQYKIYNVSANYVYVDGHKYAGGDTACTTPILTITAGPNGIAQTTNKMLPYGTYIVKETAAATGYRIDPEWAAGKRFTISSDGQVQEYTTQATWNDDPVIRGGVKVYKVDADWNGQYSYTANGTAKSERTQGDETSDFAGTEFTIWNKSRHAVVVDGATYAPDAVVKVIVADANGIAQTAATTLPYGTYLIKETKAVNGYMLNSTWQKTVQIRQQGTVVTYDSDADRVKDQVKRGGLEIHKVDFESGSNNDADANIPQGNAGTTTSGTSTGKSFKGVTYWVYNLSANPVYIKTSSGPYVAGRNTYNPGEVCIAVVAGDDGVARLAADTLPYGSYRVTEASAVPGYHNSHWTGDFQIRTNGEIVVFNDPKLTQQDQPKEKKVRNYENVMRGGVSVAKYDKDRLDTITQGDAHDHFDGIEYQIYNRSLSYVYVDGQRYERNQVVKTIVTDQTGVATTGNYLLPYGTYEIKESKSIEGYLNSNWSRTFSIDSDGYMQYYRATEATERNEDPVIRGGIEIHKYDKDTGLATPQGGAASFAGTKYVITSLSPKEVYIRGDNIYTPNKRLYDCNERCVIFEAGADGVASIPADTLPYGTYEVMELEPAPGYMNSYWKKRFSIRDEGVILVFNDKEGAFQRNEDSVARGSVTVSKVDAETKSNTPQGDATLEGTEYSIVNLSPHDVVIDGQTYAPNTTVMVITSDATGMARATNLSLPYGSYGIQETKAPAGYANSLWYQTFTIGHQGNDVAFVTSSTNNKENVDRLSKSIQIWKQDAEHSDGSPSGAASLAGATFIVRNVSANPVMVNGRLRAVGEEVLTLTTNADGYAYIGAGVLPYGSYEVTEEVAPAGYVRNSTWVGSFTVREGGEPSTTEITCPDPVIRGDVRFRKVDAANGHGLVGVVFSIKSVTTGETHFMMTGAGGLLDTGSAVALHSANTNLNDDGVTYDNVDHMWYITGDISASNGVWFSGRATGTVTPDDARGALPYDTYEIEELRCDANRDYDLVPPFQFTVTSEGYATTVEAVEDPKRTPPSTVPEHGNRVTLYKDSTPAQNTKVTPGTLMTYSIVARNTGATVQHRTLVRDYVPIGTDYVSGSASDGGVYVPSTNETQGYVEWRVDDLLPRSEKTLTFQATVVYDAPQYISNTAYVTEMPTDFTPGDPSNPKPTEESNTVTHRTGTTPTAPFVRVTKLADPAPGTQVAWRSELTYTLRVENLGGSTALSTGVFDLIPYGTELVEASQEYGGVVSGSGSRQGVGWMIPVLEAGQTVDLSMKVRVTDKSIVQNASRIANQASWADLSGLDFPSVPSNDLSNTTNIVEHPLYEAPSETSDTYKTSEPDAETVVNNGGVIRYTLTTTNSLVKVKPFVLIRDYIPEHSVYKDGSATDGGVYVDAATSANGRAYVEWVMKNVAPRESRSVSYEVTVNEDWNAYIRNIAYEQVYSESVTPGDPSNPEPSTRTNEVKHRTPTTTVDEDKFPLVKVVKSGDPASGSTVVPGQRITYTLTVTNDGKATAYNIRIFDPTPDYTTLDGISQTNNPNVSHTLKMFKAGAGWCIRRLEAGKTVQLSFTVIAAGDAEGAATSNKIIRNQAFWSYENIDNEADATIPITADNMRDQTNVIEYQLSPKPSPQQGSLVTCYKDANPKPNGFVKKNDEIEYIINAVNTGKDTQEATIVRDYIPDGTEYVQKSATQSGVYVAASDSANGRAYVEWVFGSLAPQERTQASFRVTVTDDLSTFITNMASYDRCDKNTRAGDPSAPAPTEPTNVVMHTTDKDKGTPEVVQVVKSCEPTSGSEVTRDDTIHYVLHVSNTGGSVAKSYGVYDAVPAGLVVVDGSVSSDFSGAVSGDGSYVSWLIPSLEVGQSVDLSFDAKLAPQAGDDVSVIQNQASWGQVGDIPSGPLENTSNIVELVVSRVPSASMTKEVVGSSHVSVGDEMMFSIRVRNTGDAPMVGWTLTDVPPAELTFLSDNAMGILRDDGSVFWRVDLQPGEEKVVQLRMTAVQASAFVKSKNVAILSDEIHAQVAISSADFVVAPVERPKLLQTGVGAVSGVIGLISGSAFSYEMIKRRKNAA